MAGSCAGTGCGGAAGGVAAGPFAGAEAAGALSPAGAGADEAGLRHAIDRGTINRTSSSCFTKPPGAEALDDTKYCQAWR